MITLQNLATCAVGALAAAALAFGTQIPVPGGQTDPEVAALTLEHYPGMTEAALADIVEEARERWPLDGVSVIHRVGRLAPGDPIVLVVVASAHRRAAFEACDFIMDYLKTRAPFWKKEHASDGDYWVSERDSDHADARRWEP